VRREVIHIDEDKCDGCGECILACAEGAIALVGGKAKLISDQLCDGMGACLGRCPQDAIRIEVCEGKPFDEGAVAARKARATTVAMGCPSARAMQLPPAVTQPRGSSDAHSALGHWPVQLHLVPPAAPFLQGSDLLICATCVPVAMPDFHARLLAGRTIVVACPKLDDQGGYFEKLVAMFAGAQLRSVTVARIEVPCCTGLVRLAQAAYAASGARFPLRELVIGRRGEVLQENDMAARAA
jgi:Pyruvate/2-oxoacid:ferredoxin oxidoreductase delta subunit